MPMDPISWDFRSINDNGITPAPKINIAAINNLNCIVNFFREKLKDAASRRGSVSKLCDSLTNMKDKTAKIPTPKAIKNKVR